MEKTFNCAHAGSQDRLYVEKVCGFTHVGVLSSKHGRSVEVVFTPEATRELIGFLEDIVADHEKRAAARAAQEEENKKGPARFSNLSPQAQLIYKHMSRAQTISAREALADHGITSATLARRVCDIEKEGFKVNRERRNHPVTGRSYTRYSLAA